METRNPGLCPAFSWLTLRPRTITYLMVSVFMFVKGEPWRFLTFWESDNNYGLLPRKHTCGQHQRPGPQIRNSWIIPSLSSLSPLIFCNPIFLVIFELIIMMTCIYGRHIPKHFHLSFFVPRIFLNSVGGDGYSFFWWRKGYQTCPPL